MPWELDFQTPLIAGADLMFIYPWSNDEISATVLLKASCKSITANLKEFTAKKHNLQQKNKLALRYSTAK